MIRDSEDRRAQARRAVEVAAVGGHHVLIVGATGARASAVARLLVDLLPPPSTEEAVVIDRVHRLTSLNARGFVGRPFRAPHFTASVAGMVGTWPTAAWMPRPGEVSLAHGGVLFLDETPEFSLACLRAVREPLECGEGEVCMWSAERETRLPAAFQLVASTETCPCGFRGHATRACTCPGASVARYLSRLDQFREHLRVVVDLAVNDASDDPLVSDEEIDEVRDRVVAARSRLARMDADGSVAATLAAMEGSETIEVRYQDEARELRAAWPTASGGVK